MAKQAIHQAHYNPDYQSQYPALPLGEAWEHSFGNGITLRGEFVESAAGSAAPVLHFVHGNGMSCRLYEAFLGSLHERFALFLHDSQGHGLSDKGSETDQGFVGWNGSAERVAEIIHSQQQHGFLKQRALIGLGHSFGGALTLLTSAKHPKLFQSLVLLDAMMFPPAMAKAMSFLSASGLGKHSTLAKQARARGAEWDNIEAAFQYFYKRGMLKTWHDDAVYSYLHHCLVGPQGGKQALQCPPWLEASIFANAPRKLWKALDSIQVPTQLFFGTETYDFLPPAAKLAAKRNPQIKAEAVKGSHFFMLENPACLAGHPIWEHIAT